MIKPSLPFSVSVIVKGGMVQDVLSSAPGLVRIYDFDAIDIQDGFDYESEYRGATPFQMTHGCIGDSLEIACDVAPESNDETSKQHAEPGFLGFKPNCTVRERMQGIAVLSEQGLIGLRYPRTKHDVPASVRHLFEAVTADTHAGGAENSHDPVVAPPSTLTSTLRRAEAFIGGFEGDEQQQGVSELLAELRCAISAMDVTGPFQESNADGLVARITADLTALRACIEEPVQIGYAPEIYFEVAPLNHDHRFNVCHDRMGFTTVNYSEEGLVVDGFDDSGIEPIFSNCWHRSDLEVSSEEC